MAVSAGTFDALGGGISAIFGGVGGLQTASGYKAAATIYQQQAGIYGQAVTQSEQNAKIAASASAIQEMQAQRSVYQTLGGQRSDIASSGLLDSGSAQDVVRSSASQGALTMGLLREQGAITQGGYKEEALSYQAMQGAALASSQTATAQANASTSSGIGGIIGGVAKVAGALAFLSDRRTKENIIHVSTRPDGLKRYAFNYIGDSTRYVGVMADEVQQKYPAAVGRTEQGFMTVNYAAIGEQMVNI